MFYRYRKIIYARPSHNTPSVDLQLGSSAIPGVTSTTTPNADLAFVTDLGSPNVRKTGDLITLDYDEEEYQSQKFATRTGKCKSVQYCKLVWFYGT